MFYIQHNNDNIYSNTHEFGIWAFDIVHQEMVLMLIDVLALLGDNPMQSELSCHIGMRGKFFCRICMVKGPDAADRQNSSGEDPDDPNDGSESDASSVLDSEDDEGSNTRKTRGRKAETMQEMVDRVKRFVKVLLNLWWILIIISFFFVSRLTMSCETAKILSKNFRRCKQWSLAMVL